MRIQLVGNSEQFKMRVNEQSIIHLYTTTLTYNQNVCTLSIDCKHTKEDIKIKLPIKSTKKEVESFLAELHELLAREDFDYNNDLIIHLRQKVGDDILFSNHYTLYDLEYDNLDIVERLKELRVQEYSESLVDKDNVNPPILFVFGKDINGRLIYIKLKIRDDGHKYVICVSFHYAKYEMNFPYA